ncbi:MAG: SlyX family protein [Gammaproteobacteria bacterium]|nr:SlyX family protein [Gammaproteobacteria bacterium]NNC67013.1 SlyX family protein [Gammaproteobacteria bacterium]
MSENVTEKELVQRIIELETKLSFQEDLLQELNSHVITQQADIDKLTELCKLLKDQYKEIVSSLPDAASGDEVPPHY